MDTPTTTLRTRVASAGGPDASDTAPRELLTVEAAAARLSISRTRMYQLIATGDVTSIKLGRRRLIATSEVAAFVARLIDSQPAA